MSEVNDLKGIYMAGVDEATYKQLLEIAKREGISVSEAMSRVLNKGISQANLKESVRDKKLLVEG